MTALFDASSIERDYAFLDACPEALVGDVVTLPVGTLQERVAGLLGWRDALLAGRLPAEGSWPSAPVDAPIRAALQEMDLARFCRDQPDLVAALLADILAAVRQQTDAFHGDILTRLRELEDLERQGMAQAEAAVHASGEPCARMRISVSQLDKLRIQAHRDALARPREADTQLQSQWQERARVWAEVFDVFGDLGELLGRGWDLSQGVLRQTGWLEIQRLHKLLAQLPQLREIVRTLGRMQEALEGEAVLETVFQPVRRLEQELLEVRTPLVPGEMRGIERSGDISRMLPAEAAMLGHPRLRLLWHARRAERALVTYRVEGIETERVWVEHEFREEIERKRPRPVRGPILAVLDTSGSMHGLPEQVAKALVLEAVRTAHAEKRRCFLYAYSGPGQVLEHELDLSPDGVGRLLSFLGLSFGGGNDETGIMAKVVARLNENDWKKADVVFVSDGEWPAPAGLVSSVQRARKDGTRFHGVQIGNRGRTGLHEVCDPVHVFRDWAAASGLRADAHGQTS